MSSSSKQSADLKMPLKDIQESTNNFAAENLIGEGGFGKVYKGKLLWYGEWIDIAARKLHRDYGQGDLEFWHEISMLSNLEHDNLVSFIGYCDEKGEKIIINKYEANKSLDKYLKDSNLSWTQRLQICVKIARALKYLHDDEGHDSSVIHRNIKSSKVLLDQNWEPKLSAFGVSKKNTRVRKNRLLLAEVVGTLGYVDPAYEKTGFVTHKSDVYSFGVLLFEVLCGMKAFVPDNQREEDSPQYSEEEISSTERLEHVTNAMATLNSNGGHPLMKHTKSSTPTRQTSEPSQTYRLEIGRSPPSLGVHSLTERLNDGSLPAPVLSDLNINSSRCNSFPERVDDRVLFSSVWEHGQPSSFANNQPPSYANNQPTSFANSQPKSFANSQPTSFANSQPKSFANSLPTSFGNSQPTSHTKQVFEGVDAQDYIGINLVGKNFRKFYQDKYYMEKDEN